MTGELTLHGICDNFLALFLRPEDQSQSVSEKLFSLRYIILELSLNSSV